MEILLYNTSSPPNKVVKSLGSSSKKYNAKFFEKNALSVTNPSILLNMGTEVANIVKYNYLKIVDFNRFYYFDVVSTEGGLVRLDCKVDPLMSFKDDIIDNSTNAPSQYIMRSQNINNKLIVDNMLPMYSSHTFDIKNFGEPVFTRDCSHVILETVGKGGTPS